MAEQVTIVQRLVQQARRLAAGMPNFAADKGPGKNAGNGFTRGFQLQLQGWVKAKFPHQIEIERQAIGGARYAFDYYIAREQAVVEVALSIHKSNTEFEKDVLKCLLAKQNGLKIRRLVFVGKPGAKRRLSEGGPLAIASYAKNAAGIIIQVEEIG